MTDIDRAADIEVSRGFAQVTVRIPLTVQVSRQWLSHYKTLAHKWMAHSGNENAFERPWPHLLTCRCGVPPVTVLGLQWSALDWNGGTLLVTQSVKRIKNRDRSSSQRTRLVVSELKTPRSRRTLALTAVIVSSLRQHRARQAEARIAAGSLWRDHGLIFTTEVGTPIDPDHFSHDFSKLCKDAGLGHWWRCRPATC